MIDPVLQGILDGATRWDARLGDALEVLRELPDGCVDSLVTDPPSSIRFMSQTWDCDRGGRVGWTRWLTAIMRECLRVLRPGAHGLVWALPRRTHWTAVGIEDAGFELRDRVAHLFGGAMAKSRQIDGGRGSGLKPAVEDWWLIRKPLEGTIAGNVASHGTGALEVDACRVQTADKLTRRLGSTTTSASGWESANRSPVAGKDGGRYPANLLLTHAEGCAEGCSDDCPVGVLDRQSGSRQSTSRPRRNTLEGYRGTTSDIGVRTTNARVTGGYDDAGGASRFFPTFEADVGAGFLYQAKAPRKEKDLGLPEGEVNIHPTVKSVALMRWLVRLVTPPDGVCLDPFAGSGSTLVAAVLEERRSLSIEQRPDYFRILCHRATSAEAATRAP